MKKLAILGGKPTFSSPLYVGRPNIGSRKKLNYLINDMLDRKWLTNNGPFAVELENNIKEYLSVKHCILTCNCTTALQIAARAIDLHGEVIVPSFTFVATAHALEWIGLKPVFCDVNPATHNIDPKEIDKSITQSTSGIIGVHLWGRPCDIESLEQISKRYKIRLMFDAAHAFSCSYQGRMIGNFGNCEVFSFHATKSYNTFEGGAIVTNDPEIAEKAKFMRDFGFSKGDTVVSVGINGKMSEASAAMGLTGFEILNDIIDTNRRNYIEYKSNLSDLPGISIIDYNDTEKNNYHYIVVEVEENLFGLSRDELLLVLNYEKVMARRYFYPGCHRCEPYRSSAANKNLYLPFTEMLSNKVLSLPNGTAVNRNDVNKICSLIKLISENSFRIKKVLAEKI